MLTNKDRDYAKKRKRVWDNFGWVYRGVNYLSKNHSLNCGCSMCKMKTYYNRLGRKQERINARRALEDEVNAL
jgi:hypothetical protein